MAQKDIVQAGGEMNGNLAVAPKSFIVVSEVGGMSCVVIYHGPDLGSREKKIGRHTETENNQERNTRNKDNMKQAIAQ